MPFPAAVEQWRQPLRRAGSDAVDVTLAWMAKESGGNVCATGIAGVEAGLVQTFHPSDDRFGLTFAQLRAPCSGGSQSLARQLTSDEVSAFAQQAVTFVRGKRNEARVHLAIVGARWGEGVDFWTAVKQEHALPCVMSDLLPRVTSRLGRAPRGWDEFRRIALAMSPSEMGAGCAKFAASPSLRGLSSRLADTMANAEEIGRFGGGLGGLSGIGGTLLKLAIAGGLAYAAYTLVTDSDPGDAPPA